MEIEGKYTSAKIFAKTVEDSVIEQVKDVVNHPIFKDCKIRIMPDCLSYDTEVLTSKGFKYIKDIDITQDLVANYYLEDSQIVFEKPKNKIVRPLRPTETVYEQTQNKIGLSIISTENHRTLINNSVLKTKDVPNITYIRDYKWSAITQGKGLNISDNMLKLLTWVIGDGSIKYNKNNNPIQIRFSFTKDRKIKRLTQLLETMKIPYILSKASRKDTEISIHINKADTIEIVKYLDNKKEFNLSWLENISNHQCSIILEESIQVDGDYETFLRSNSGSLRFSSTNKINADFLQAISVLSGKMSSLKEKKLTVKRNPLYYVNSLNSEVLRYSKSGFHNLKIEKRQIDYNKEVVCLTVSSGFMMVRQKGFCFITGNCHAGKGCVIGFTSELPKNGEIIPNIIGVDQSCTISAYRIEGKQTRDYFKLDKVIREKVPVGTGGRRKELHRLITNAAPIHEQKIELIRKYTKDWLNEEPDTELYKIGTLGSGNHFISLEKGETGLWLLLHSGSRNFGNRMAIEFQKKAIEKHCYGEGKLKELSYLDGKDAEEYLKVASLCNWYAETSHIIMANEIIEAMDFKVLEHIETVHNMIDQNDKIIRKGAISCYSYEKVIIPINMAYGTFLAKGKNNEDWNNSGPHGAGRVLSRTQAKEQLTMNKYKESMKGIHSCCITRGTLDEAPMAYKDGDEIKEMIEPTAEIYDHLIPVYNFKAI